MKAIVGARPDKAKNNKNTIWGWGEIARLTAPAGPGSSQYKEQFHEARFNLALCRHNYAVCQKDATAKKDLFQRAKSDIAIIAGFYPDLGGDRWKGQYDSLLKNIQKALGEPPVGLSGLQTAPPAAAGGGKVPGAAKTVPTSTSAPAVPAKGPAPARGPA